MIAAFSNGRIASGNFRRMGLIADLSSIAGRFRATVARSEECTFNVIPTRKPRS